MRAISVIISTHKHKNREINLCGLIESLLFESNLDYLQEIVIIDNGCSLLISDELCLKHQIIKIIREPKIGLNNARNCGIKNSKGTIVAFLDDDIFVSESWAENIYKSHQIENTLCVGGSVVFKDVNEELPSWLTGYFTRFFFPPTFPAESGVLRPPYYLIGANMSFKRGVFKQFGFFDSELDRKGNNLLSNGDTEFIIRLPIESIYYSLGAKVFGVIKKERFTRFFMIRRLFWQGISDYIMVKNNGVSNFYDKNEIFLSKKFFKFFLSKLLDVRFFECFCFLIRIFGYISGPFYLILNKKKG